MEKVLAQALGRLEAVAAQGEEVDLAVEEGRRQEDVGEADIARRPLAQAGIVLEDTAAGTTWRR